MSGFVEIGVTTNFSFLRGAAHPQDYAVQAYKLGFDAIGIADRNTLAGIVRMYDRLNEMKEQTNSPVPQQLVGSRLVFVDGTPDILAYPTDRKAYGRLCRLLSKGKWRAPKGECFLTLDDLLEWQEGLLLVVMPPYPYRGAPIQNPSEKFWNADLLKLGGPDPLPGSAFASRIKSEPNEVHDLLKKLQAYAPDRIWLGVSLHLRGEDRQWLAKWETVAKKAHTPLLATNDVLYDVSERRELQDVVTCIREHVTLDEAGYQIEKNAERFLKSPAEMSELFAAAPDAIAQTVRFSDRIKFSLRELGKNYPEEPVPPGKTADQHLADLARAGILRRYTGEKQSKVQETLEKELALIAKLEIAPYFLTVYDIVQFARNHKPEILCQGRGSAANSVVCYALGITSVSPDDVDLLFERFVSQERKEPPDIDVDFEHAEREKVIQYVYERYGRPHAALTATVIHYRPRSAIRETGKVFGLTEDITADLASGVWGSWGSRLSEQQVRQGKLDPFNLKIARAVKAANDMMGFPRHLSQHVGGFVLTKDRLDEIVPTSPATMEDRFFIEWDKDDLDHVGLMKVDVLALGMLTCIRKAFELIRVHNRKPYELWNVPREDPAVYDMLCDADAIGVFQVESRAQMNMLPRLRPRKFYDLVVEVAIVRPGPIQGNMVHPYLKRRKNPTLVSFPHPAPEYGDKDELKEVLGKTMGVPLFQEQAMRLAMVAAKFSPEDANKLRRSMATFRNLGTIGEFETKMVEGMVKRGYDRKFAEDCFNQIKGFGSYGFPESHAASFSHLVYVSAWIKKYYPAAFACALLNSQPMGFYAPAEIVRDAIEHDVEVRHVDVNKSEWDNALEKKVDGTLALQLGFRQVDGFKEDWAKIIVGKRGNRFSNVDNLAKRTELSRRALMILAEADCFQSLEQDRREALWAVRRLPDDDDLPLFAAQRVEEQAGEDIDTLPLMPLSEHVLADYQMLRFSLKAHLMRFLRDMLNEEGVKSCHEVTGKKDDPDPVCKDGDHVICAGIVLTRQMPGDKGVVFVTLSDETGVTNVVVWKTLVEEFRAEIMGARLMLVEGKIQRSPEGVVHLVAERIFDRTHELERLSEDYGTEHAKKWKGRHVHRHPRNVRVVPKSRDFH